MSRSKILLIYTGGTIGMVQNVQTGALESCDFGTLVSCIPELALTSAEITSVSFRKPIDSSDMDPAAWSEIVHIISDNYEEYDGFVVLHGTDTMAFTASALSFMLEGLNKPVILTGSQIPLQSIRTDGKENLITAIEIAASKDENGHPVVPEVCIYFHEKLMRGNRSSKVSASNLSAFVSSNYPLLAQTGTEISFHTEYIRPYDPARVFKPHFLMEPSIVIFSLFPGIRQDIVESILRNESIKGVIFRTFGSGNAPQRKWLVDALSDAVKMGKVIVNITQCATGSVEMNKYETGLQLLEAGVISGRDITVEASITKLMFLLGHGIPQKEAMRRMSIPIAGEMS